MFIFKKNAQPIIINRKGVNIMKGRLLTGIAAGALMGAAASMVMMPQMSYKNRRRAARISKRVARGTGSMMDGIRSYIR